MAPGRRTSLIYPSTQKDPSARSSYDLGRCESGQIEFKPLHLQAVSTETALIVPFSQKRTGKTSSRFGRPKLVLPSNTSPERRVPFEHTTRRRECAIEIVQLSARQIFANTNARRQTFLNSGLYFTNPYRPPSASGFSSATMNTPSGTSYSDRSPFKLAGTKPKRG